MPNCTKVSNTFGYTEKCLPHQSMGWPDDDRALQNDQIDHEQLEKCRKSRLKSSRCYKLLQWPIVNRYGLCLSSCKVKNGACKPSIPKFCSDRRPNMTMTSSDSCPDAVVTTMPRAVICKTSLEINMFSLSTDLANRPGDAEQS